MPINSDGESKAALDAGCAGPANGGDLLAPVQVMATDSAAGSGVDSEVAIAAAIAANNLGRAAELAHHAGQFLRAAELYERIWDFTRATAAAQAAGDPSRALRYALSTRDEALVQAQITLLEQANGVDAAIDMLLKARRFRDAAVVAERAGQLAVAAEQYKRAHSDLDAARMFEAIGQDRDAGQLLERYVDIATPDERPAAALALGRILVRRAAYPAAAKWLQEAAKHPGSRNEALQHLAYCLAAMGLRDGARDALAMLRELDATQPVDLDTFLRNRRDQAPTPGKRERETVAGRYQLQQLLGAGAAGRVFLATDIMTAQPVAVKMFFAASARGSAAYERFAREAKITSGIRHPSLVEVYDVSLEHGFIVMEYMAGGSLADRLRTETRLPSATVRRLAMEICEALTTVHHRGVIHRDIKPANLFFDARGTAKLGDFGVAHLADLGQTQTGGMIGTLAYMSPEQITGAPITVAADLYSLGIALFEALTGRLPFLGPDFVAQHLGEAAPAPSSIVELDVAWDHIVAKLLAKNPSDRLGSASELTNLLRHVESAGTRFRVPATGPTTVLTNATTNAAANAAIAGGSDSDPASSQTTMAAASDAARYQFETPFRTTPLSVLSRAVDTVLQRSVVLERFNATASQDTGDVASADAANVIRSDAAMDRIRVLARAASPFVQRVLSLDRAARVAIFEAPAGRAFRDITEAYSPAERVRMLKRLARGIAAVAELGQPHGAITSELVLLDDYGIPTILLAGSNSELTPTATSDVKAILAVLEAMPGETIPGWHTVRDATEAEELYRLADNLETLVLVGTLAP
ncbi:MAG: protein kinase [Kofleriaceae bacterium]|nr:protein kinase [Kofleriaceae bacterium]